MNAPAQPSNPIKVLVLLVGGRQAPNVISASTYRPYLVELITSEDEKEKADQLRETLGSIEDLTVSADERIVPAFDVQKTRDACEVIFKKHSKAQILVNLTCSTKLMSIAAYEAAREAANGQDIAAFYMDTGRRTTITLVGKKLGKPNVPQHFPEYVRAYGREVQQALDLRMASEGVPGALELANRLAKGYRAKIKPMHTSTDKKLIQGHWLEAYTWDLARNIEHKNKPLFTDVRYAQKIISKDGAENEIDVAAMYNGQAILISCKTGKGALGVEHLDQLRTVSSLIGGRYCTRIYVTNHRIGDPRRGFIKQAEARQIYVVGKEELQGPELQKVLTREALNPIYPGL